MISFPLSGIFNYARDSFHAAATGIWKWSATRAEWRTFRYLMSRWT